MESLEHIIFNRIHFGLHTEFVIPDVGIIYFL